MPEETPMPPAEMPMPEAPVAPPQDGGSVMISMPSDAFNAMREIVAQLAMGLEQLAQSVDQQAAGAQAPVAPEVPVPPVPPVTAGDEEFLNSMAQEASAGR
jgi:hypothetical protein